MSTSTKNFERIKKTIQDSVLLDPDKEEMTAIFSRIDDDYLPEIAELFEKNAVWIYTFNDNRKKKQEAFTSGNSQAWDDILEEEKKHLDDLMAEE